MLKENHDLKGALEQYIELLSHEAFFEAHEVLEEAWHPLRKANHPLKNLVKGLINGAIAFEHIRRGRKGSVRKATTVFNSYLRHQHLYSAKIEHQALFFEAINQIEALRLRYLVEG